jgi:hypothetical protein
LKAHHPFSSPKVNKIIATLESLELYQTSGMSHCGLSIYIKKYLMAKEEL